MFFLEMYGELFDKYLNKDIGVKVGSVTKTSLMHCNICYDLPIVTNILDSISKISKSLHAYLFYSLYSYEYCSCMFVNLLIIYLLIAILSIIN